MVKRKKDRSGKLTNTGGGLYLGNKAAGKDRFLLENLGIRGIVNIGAGKRLYDDIAFYKVGLKDNVESPRVLTMMRETADAIESMLLEANGAAVLIHCVAGMSRSPAFTVAYLHLKRGMTVEEALLFVQTARPCVRIAPPLLDALESLQQQSSHPCAN